MSLRFLSLLGFVVLALVACRPEANNNPTNLNVELGVLPENPAVGEASLLISITDKDGNAVNDASISIVGNMSHAGMAPVLAEVIGGENGDYIIPFAFTMGGDWLITANITLADGSQSSHEFAVNGVSGSTDMEDMNHDMSNMGTVSGAYLSITNTSDTDINLVAVTAPNVGEIQFHQTVVENDIARMEEHKGNLLIPAGETFEFSPSGYHLMLMQLERDLYEGETLLLTLEFDNGASITIDASIAVIEPETLKTVETEGLIVSGAWLRPTALALEVQTEEAEGQ